MMKKATQFLMGTLCFVLLGSVSALGQVTFDGNGNTGFGDVIGNGSIEVSDDGTTVTMVIDRASGALNDGIVIYIDSDESVNITSTTSLTDSGDDGRKTISGYDGSSRSTITFSDGFLPDYGISLRTDFAGLFKITESGSHTFVTSVNLSPTGNSTADTYTIDFDFSEIGMSSDSTFKFVANVVSNTAFRSDEAVGTPISGDNPGQNPVTFSGYNTYQAQVNISGNAGWRMLSLPISDGTVEDISDDTAVQGITDGDNAGEASNFYINTASDGTQGNGYAEPTNVSTAWGDGLGFIVYFYDNATAGSSELPITLDASGSEPSSDVTVTLSDTYTLVGNPFASNFSLDELSGNDSGVGVNNGLVSPVNFWDDGAGTDASGSWVTQNFGSNNDNVASTWSGFFVQRNSGATTQLTIPTSGKTADDATAAHFSKEVANTAYREIELLLESPQDQSDRSNKLYFSEQSTERIDAYDGGKFTPLNGSPYLAFVNEFGNGDELFVQDSRTLDPQEDQTYELALGDAGISGTYTLSWPEFTNIPEGWNFTLKDYETGKTVKMVPGSSYEFSVEATQQQKVVSILNLSAAKATIDEVTTRFSITLSKGTSTSNEPGDTPEGFALEQNYPNPFNPTTSIQYSVGQAGPVSLSVYNVMGQKVAELVSGTKAAGTYRVHWDAANMASGIYHYRLQSAGQVLTRQMTLIK